MPCRGTGKHRLWIEVRRQNEGTSRPLHLHWSLCWKGKAGQANSLEWTSFNNFDRLWNVRAAPSCLVPDPRSIECRRNIGLVCKIRSVFGIWAQD